MARLEIRTTAQSPGWWVLRYLTGRPVDGELRTDCGYLRPGRRVLHPSGHASRWAMLPGWKRQAVRLGAPIGACGLGSAYLAYPDQTTAAAVTVTGIAAYRSARRARRAWQMRRFNNTYIRPTLAALAGTLGDAPVKLDVSPDLGNLVPRLAKPMSPAEKAVRAWYGEHVEPVVRWLPDHVQRARWRVQTRVRPLTSKLDVFRRPVAADTAPSITLRTSVPYLTPQQRDYIKAVISAKIPAGDLSDTWDQVGDQVTARWTVKARPPARVGYADLDARFGDLAEWEFFVGLGPERRPVIISLREDSPHVACSAGTGAGKSVFAQSVAVQVLARGGRVVILDLKGSHRWALGMPGVDYCTRPEQMHAALIALGRLADERNQQAFTEAEDWDPGYRVLLIFEEMNATAARLRDYWTENRTSSDPKTSPAITAFRSIMFMGRSAKVNAFAVAQMLTAHTTGGPESRENFGIRALARYSANNWKMLVPEAAMPRASRTLGRWQIVVGGRATETQVCYLAPAEARLFVHKHAPVSPHAHSPLVAPDQELSPGHGDSGDKRSPFSLASVAAPADPLSEQITLREAVDRKIAPWAFAATKKRLQRARTAQSPTAPEPVGKNGQADLYTVADLIVWIESELVA